MLSTPKVLSFGYDSALLRSRGMVLARAGLSAINAASSASFQCEIQGRHIDLLLLCHTLTRTDCVEALRLAAAWAPAAKVLVLRSGNDRGCCLSPDHFFDVRRGPADLITRVQTLTLPFTHPKFPEEIDRHGYV